VPGEQPNPVAFWPIYPAFLHDLFTRAFTEGIHDPQNGRVREGEWRAALIRLRDSIVICANCAAENFYEVSLERTAGTQPGVCWSCRREIVMPPRLTFGKNVLILNRDTQLFPHHVDMQRMYDFSSPIGEVTRHPSDPRIWGLKNLSEEKWTAITGDGQNSEVPPGRSLTLKTGTRINFGKSEGTLEKS
jgi:hypothetical protein